MKSACVSTSSNSSIFPGLLGGFHGALQFPRASVSAHVECLITAPSFVSVARCQLAYKVTLLHTTLGPLLPKVSLAPGSVFSRLCCRIWTIELSNGTEMLDTPHIKTPSTIFGKKKKVIVCVFKLCFSISPGEKWGYF